MDVSGKRRQIIDLRGMCFAVQQRLIQMRDRPALRDVESEQFGELFHSFTGHGVSPGTECGKLIAVLVKWQVAVHHGRNADSTNRCKLLCVFLLEVRFQRCEAGLQARLRVRKRIRPHAAGELVFPCEAAGGDRQIAFIQQNGLDAGGTEFNAEYSFA